MASRLLLRSPLGRFSSANRAPSLSTARAFTSSSSSLPLPRPLQPSLAAARLARIQSKVTHSTLNLPPTHLSTSISGLFTFTRRTNALYDHVKRLWVEDREEGETDMLQATTLLVLEEQEMINLVKGRKDREVEGAEFIEMVERVREFTAVGKGQLANGEMADESTKGRVICVVLGWSSWEGKDREDRKWREKVVGDLVVKGGCFVHDVSTVEEATSFLWTSFGHIAVRRHSRLDHSTPTPPPPPVKVRRSFDTKAPRKGVNSLDTFGLMHQKITRGSEDKSRAITNEFASLRKLLERYDQEEGRGEKALQELYPVGENGKPQQKKIGPAFSKKVHKIWSLGDPEEVV